MLRNKRGELATATLLIYVIGALVLFFVPNKLSTSLGVGNRQNKIVQTEKVELIKDKEGNPIAYKTTTSDSDQQQQIGFLEWLTSLPFLVLFLMGLGVVFPPVSLFLGSIYRGLKADTKRIVVGVDSAMTRVKDEELRKAMYLEMGNRQDTSTKALVDKIQGKK